MATTLPPTFVDLWTAYAKHNEVSNIIGVCVDFLPPVQTRRTDSTIKFTLHDSMWPEGKGMPVRFFDRNQSNLPSIANTGDVVIIRNLKMKLYNGQWLGLSNSSTTWVVLSGTTIQESTCVRGTDIQYIKSEKAGCPSSAELAYAKHIAKMEDPTNFSAPQKATALQVANIMSSNGGNPPPKRDKFSLVQDLEVEKFAEILGEVRRIFSDDFRVELSITDYTSHPKLFDYINGMDKDGLDGDRYGYMSGANNLWPGPWGKKTIVVTLWELHASFARQNVREGCFVYLRNVQIKMDKNGIKLEGHCRGDRYYPNRVNVSTIKPSDAGGDERMMELLRRKREYERQAKVQKKRFVPDAATSNSRLEPKVDDERKQHKSKNARKRERQEQKKRITQAGHSNLAVINKGGIAKDEYKWKSNSQVRCNRIEVRLKPIDEILDNEMLRRITPNGATFYLPFQNCRYKSKVRVIDYFPDDIADFAAPHLESGYELLSDYESEEESEIDPIRSSNTEATWQWRFILLVEDAGVSTSTNKEKKQMELLVADTDGDYLLDMNACDLRNRPDQLAILREKLFVLWGNLQEEKEASGTAELDLEFRPQARPFECLIKEYQVSRKRQKDNATEMERMFRLFGTTVKGADVPEPDIVMTT